MTSRDIYNQNTSPAPSGTDFLTQYGNLMTILFDDSVLHLANVLGADTITADVDPVMPTAGYATGMKFTFKPASDNTAAATINIGGAGAKAVVASDGTAMTAGDLLASTRYLLEYDGINLVILGAIPGGIGGSSQSRTTYDVTTVWTNSLLSSQIVKVELWGAGGGGNGQAGGGGGAYTAAIFKGSDLPGSLTITIPAGGAIDTDGGNATFGSLLTAYGGGKGVGGVGNGGGGGGGEVSAGASTSGGSIGGAAGVENAAGPNALTIHGGGAGGDNSLNGGDGAFGGAGGGGAGAGLGGKSARGGNGGDNGTSGARPGGGGGRLAAGGGGRCIVTVF